MDLVPDRGPPVRDVLSHPKRTALLTLLALESDGGPVQRDTAIGLLWADSDTRRARNALSQILHHLRKALGKEAVAGRSGDLLQLDLDIVSCDAIDFLRAVEANDRRTAFDLYRGELLPGFHLSNAGPFERWLSGVRMRLRAAHVEVAASLIEECESRDDLPGAIDIATRALAVRPGDERGTRRLMALLDQAGDRLAALRVYDRLQAFMAAEFESEPSSETRELAARIRGPVVEAAPPDRRPTRRLAEAAPPAPTATPTPSRGRGLAWAGAAAVLVALAAYGTSNRTEPSVSLDDTTRLTVLPFEVRGPEEASYLSESMVTLLASRLDGRGGMRAVDPRALLAYLRDSAEEASDAAEHFSASHYVLGDVVAVGDQLEVSAALFDTGAREPVASARAIGPTSSLIDLVDQLAAGLLASESMQVGSRTAQLGAIGTDDFVALQHFLEGDRLMRSGRFSDAVGELEAAVARDESFAFAHYQLAVAANWADDVPTSLRALEAAQAGRERLSTRSRALVDALANYLARDYREARRRYEDVVANYPDQLEAWYMLGESIFHGGSNFGMSLTEARPMFERVLQYDPRSSDALIHLIRISARDGDRAELASLAERFIELNPQADRSLEVRALTTFASGDEAARESMLAELGSAPDLAVALSAIGVAAFLDDLAGAREITELLRTRPEGTYARWADVMTARLALAQGRFREAKALLPGLDPRDRPGAVGRLAYWVAMTGLTYGADADYRRLVDQESTNPYHPHETDLAHGLLAATLGDAAEAARRADVLAVPIPQYAAGVRAWAAWSREAPEDALRIVRASFAPEGREPVFSAGQSERLLYGWALVRVGDTDRAREWLGSFGDHTGYDIQFVAPALLASIELHANLGERDTVTRLQRRLDRLWVDADPEARELISQGVDRRTSAMGR